MTTTPTTRSEALAAGRKARSDAAHAAFDALRGFLRDLVSGQDVLFGRRA